MPPDTTQATNHVPRKRDTRQRLIETGMPLLLRHGYNDLGLQMLLRETRVPKGSFYHHFRDKEDFALAVIDAYMDGVHQGMAASLGDHTLPPLVRIRTFFEMTAESYRDEGYMGCLLGGLGQELSGISDVFRDRISVCFGEIAGGMAGCLAEARARGDIAADSDVDEMAARLVDCWEGAALRSRLTRDPAALMSMLDFYFAAITGKPVQREA
ncbi:TetR/AcrR family transcriptional regulator [Maritimibacter sp. UBA3975]|uniref:TetR/AcrR family transcriptional regulator n=1 Tax=Maritimibacter sp. UBA3975 TaxID=1946833 RepID=UPI000C08E569|nr:TetR/AcrR family transcriptional regulator [Maritimibacter sp. UBA3975]MAM61086.1 TetR family transcriptional regulator [Maritimibacter sp.]|tara:strand:+ start:26845 stop:27480 length:636 start_codon:yes stop_codon:yes gene_type:complete